MKQMGRIFTLLLMLALPLSGYAADGGETTITTTGEEVPGPTSGGSCDWSGLKKSLGFTESGGKYTITNPWNYLGKYQFGEARLNSIGWWSDPQKVDPGQCSGSGNCEVQCKSANGVKICYQEFSGNWTGEAYSKYGITSYQAFLNNPEAQDRAFDLHAALAYQETKPCHKDIGRTITDRKGRTCQVTLSGIIAGAHLAGAGSCSRGSGVCGYLCKGSGSSDGATHVSDYICSHAGISVPMDPGQCSGGKQPTEVSPSDPGTQPGTDPEFKGIGTEGPIIEHYDMIGDLINHIWIASLQKMAAQLTATMMAQVETIGMFFDAKHQLETQRLLQQKTAQAHKDYQPSEQMCTIGTFSRNLANTDRRAHFSQVALSQRALQRDSMAGDAISTQGRFSDQVSRFNTFREKFCNPKDNAGGNADLCVGTPDPDMMNKDIDFTRALDMPLTLDFDVLDPAVSNDELAIFALMDNLFLNKPPKAIAKEITTLEAFTIPYQDLRSVMAMRSVARNSMNNIISQKSYGPKTEDEKDGSNAPYLRAFIKDMGITDEEEITLLLGERPSYWAQMEVLTKKLYQHPGFTVNLYDKPANVTRMRAAMRAIKTMQDRDIYEALLRREMLLSILTELSVRKQQARVDNFVRRGKFNQ